MKEKYTILLEKTKEIQIISQIDMLLGWDTETKMPKGGVIQRSEQQAFIARLAHGKQTSPEIGELLKEIQGHPDYEKLSDIEKRNIHLIQKSYDRETKIPVDFVAEYARASVISTEKWKEAREKNDFEIFKPHLKTMFEMAQKYANYLNPDLPPYEVLLDIFEPEMNVAKYNEIFNPLKEATIELLNKCHSSDVQPDYSLMTREVPKEIQQKLAYDVMKLLSFDTERGRLDEAAHPFTSGDYDDVRITTRYNLTDFTSSLFAVMHEGGHGCYDQNLERELRYQPVGNYCSMGVHESQSRFYENIIGRSKSFWSFYLDKFKEITGDIFVDIKYEDFIRAINKVQSSLIRVEADEVTYNLHIILRFELERDLFEGRVSIDDLPEVWVKKMKEMLDIDVPTVADGVLQDIHWSGGAFGYFPTYTLGNVYGAQFFAKLTKDIPDWHTRLENGEVNVLTDWVTENVQKKGNIYDPPELVKEVTGEYPTPKYLIEFLQEKYSYLYGF